MTIEILYPEFCMMYGDRANISLIKNTFKDAEIIETHYRDVPYFVNAKPDFIYIGSMAETNVSLVLDELMPYKSQLKDYVLNDGYMLVTGNASDIFGKEIRENSKVIDTLNIFDYVTERNLKRRHNCIFLGKYKDIDIVGNKTQFSLYKTDIKDPFIEVTGGFGSDIETATEGTHFKNSYVTSLHGPFLILNPLFTKELFKDMGYGLSLPLEKEMMDAYNFRLARMKEEGAVFAQDDHGR